MQKWTLTLDECLWVLGWGRYIYPTKVSIVKIECIDIPIQIFYCTFYKRMMHVFWSIRITLVMALKHEQSKKQPIIKTMFLHLFCIGRGTHSCGWCRVWYVQLSQFNSCATSCSLLLQLFHSQKSVLYIVRSTRSYIVTLRGMNDSWNSGKLFRLWGKRPSHR